MKRSAHAIYAKVVVATLAGWWPRRGLRKQNRFWGCITRHSSPRRTTEKRTGSASTPPPALHVCGKGLKTAAARRMRNSMHGTSPSWCCSADARTGSRRSCGFDPPIRQTRGPQAGGRPNCSSAPGADRLAVVAIRTYRPGGLGSVDGGLGHWRGGRPIRPANTLHRLFGFTAAAMRIPPVSGSDGTGLRGRNMDAGGHKRGVLPFNLS